MHWCVLFSKYLVELGIIMKLLNEFKNLLINETRFSICEISHISIGYGEDLEPFLSSFCFAPLVLIVELILPYSLNVMLVVYKIAEFA